MNRRRTHRIHFPVLKGYIVPAVYKLAEGFADDFDPLAARGVIIGSDPLILEELPMFYHWQAEEESDIELIFSKRVKTYWSTLGTRN